MIRGSKESRDHDMELAELLARLTLRAFPRFKPDLVVSVPERPGQEDRFRTIRSEVARRVDAATGHAVLRQIRDVEGYRQMTRAQRRRSVAGSFLARGSVRGKSVLVVDDVVTSGGKAREAVRALMLAGAVDWRFSAVARATAAPGDPGTRATSPVIGAYRDETSQGEAPVDCGVPYDHAMGERSVLEVVAFEALPPEVRGSRRAVVRWSDGTVGEALRWYEDEVLFCEGDLLGKTEAQLRGLHFNRDRDYLSHDRH